MRRVGDDRGSPGRKPRQHQCRPAPQVGGLHHGAAQMAARRNGQHPARRFGLCAQAAKTLGTAEPALKNHVLDAALAVGTEHCRRQQRGSIGGKGRIGSGEHPACPVQPTKAGNSHRIPCRFHPAPHLSQNFQHRRIERRGAAGQFHPAARRRTAAGQRGSKNAVGQGRKTAPGKAPPPFDADRGAACPLDAAAAPVQKSGKVGDLRFPGRPPQDGPASGTGSGQQKCLGGPYAGETQGDLSPVQAGGSRQHQPPFPSFQLHRPHFCQPRQMQVDGPGPDAAPAGQAGLGAAQPCQQGCAEQDGGPHLSRCLPRQGAVGRRTGEYCITALPPGGTAHAPQKRHAVFHVRKAGHSLEPHLSRAEQRCRKKRQNAVFRCRNFYASVQRSAPCHHDPFLHVRAPIPQKIPHRMQNRAGV